MINRISIFGAPARPSFVMASLVISNLVGGSDVSDNKSSVRSVATTWRYKSARLQKIWFCHSFVIAIEFPTLSQLYKVHMTIHCHLLVEITWNHVQWPYWSAMVLWCQYRKIQINQFLQVYGILVEDILYWCIICMLRQRNVFTQYIYNKEKQHDNEREGSLRRIPVCDMHQPISQIILWWCIYQRICIHRSYSLNNTIISIFCFYCIHLKLNVYIK